MKPGKPWGVLKVRPIKPHPTSRFGGPSVQFKICFQKKFKPYFTKHEYYLP